MHIAHRTHSSQHNKTYFVDADTTTHHRTQHVATGENMQSICVQQHAFCELNSNRIKCHDNVNRVESLNSSINGHNSHANPLIAINSFYEMVSINGCDCNHQFGAPQNRRNTFATHFPAATVPTKTKSKKEQDKTKPKKNEKLNDNKHRANINFSSKNGCRSLSEESPDMECWTIIFLSSSFVYFVPHFS